MSGSSQSRVGKVRPPRVHITYDVEDGGESTTKELPLVAGVVSDLSGDSTDPARYTDRNFVEVQAGGVNRLMKKVGPELRFNVQDKISGKQGSEIVSNLGFSSLDDFSPMGVATQLPQTAKLLEARRQLSDLYGKVEANETLDSILGDILSDADKQSQLRAELGIDFDSNTESEEDDEED